MLENNNTEFKKIYSDTLVKTLVAFSNCSGGKIIVGVDDDGNAIGLEDSDDTSKKCRAAIADKVRPDITLNTNVTIEEEENKTLVIIEVREGDKKPYFIRDKGLRAEGVYIREGSSSIPVTEDMFHQMIANSRSLEFEEHISFVQNLTFNYLRTKFEEKLITLTNENMKSLHINKNEKYTQLGFILSDQFDCTLKIAAYNDDFKTAFIDRAEFGGCVLKQMDEAMAFISRYNRNSSIINGKYREDTRDYSEVTIREALANAIVHRDYAMDDSILISVLPSKITIVSPGGLKRPFTIEELMSGVSSLRNRNLASVMYRLKIIEAYGTGIPRIFNSYNDLTVKPTIVNGGSTFTISLPVETEIKKTAIQVFLERKTEFTRAELEESLGISKSEAVSEINILLKTGNIVKVGQGRSTKYKVRRIV